MFLQSVVNSIFKLSLLAALRNRQQKKGASTTLGTEVKPPFHYKIVARGGEVLGGVAHQGNHDTQGRPVTENED